MGLSETVLAAMIGAAATMLTALTQLMLSLRAKVKADSRPRRNAFRSLMWMLALLVASGVGGFAYSELRAERTREDTRELRKELTEQLQALALSTAKLELLENGPAGDLASLASATSIEQAAESIVHVPACKTRTLKLGNDPSGCDESAAPPVELCVDVPASSAVAAIELYARSDASFADWTENGVTLNEDFGGGRFVPSTFAYPVTAEVRAVCTRLVHWSSDHGRVARMVVRYTLTPTLSAAQATVAARP
jgi:ABC-type multidrug transport system fused ATPase/permease subunit